jgi:hypothetical protein
VEKGRDKFLGLNMKKPIISICPEKIEDRFEAPHAPIDPEQEAFLSDERRLLNDLLAVLARLGILEEDEKSLQRSIQQPGRLRGSCIWRLFSCLAGLSPVRQDTLPFHFIPTCLIPRVAI